jgi:hypothetical protein
MRATLVLTLLFIGVSGYISVAMAQSPGTFTATGNMSTPRAGHTATLLLDGRVLIAGGYAGPGTAYASAELYDPAIGTFTPTGNMTTPRVFHAAALLPNGKVLIAGGEWSISDPSFLSSAELYDPSSGTFSLAGVMRVARVQPVAILLNNGKVLITGGFGGDSLASLADEPTAELYDPSTGTFTATGSMNVIRNCPNGTLLANGKVLITYGTGCDDLPAFLDIRPTQSAELYDPNAGTFTVPDGPYSSILAAAFAVKLLPSGKVLLGFSPVDCPGPSSAELYDPTSENFTATGNMAYAACSSTGALLSDGTVLISGGDEGCAAGGLASAEVYDPASGTFSRNGDMTTGRRGHTATLLNNGSVLIMGGVGRGFCGPPPSTLATAELYHPAVAVAPPVLLSLPGGQAAIQHTDTYQLVTADHPAVAGEIIVIYCTGLSDGSVIPPQVAVDGRMGELLFFGNTPGYQGLNQLNVRVPGGVAPGAAVSVRLTYLGRPSNAVTMAVR